MKLDESHKKLPFRVPDNYFEEFPDRMARRVREESGKGRGRMVSLPGIIKLGIAASFLVLATLGVFYLVEEERSADQILAEVPTESLIAYLEESDLTIDEMMEIIDVELVIPEGDLMDSGLLSDDEIDETLIEEIITDYELEL